MTANQRPAPRTSRVASLALPAILLALVAVNVSNVWRLRVYPITDLPNHLAEAALLRQLRGGEETAARYYAVHPQAPIVPNSAHPVFCSLFGDVELGNRIWYSAYVIALIAVVYALISFVGGDRRLTLLAVPLIFNYTTMWGFTGFMLAIPLSLAIFLLSYHYSERPSFGKAAGLAVSLLALYYTHAQVFLFLVPLCALTILLSPHALYRKVLYCLPLLPSAVVFVLWRVLVPEFRTHQPMAISLFHYFRTEYVWTFAERVFHLFLAETSRLGSHRLSTTAGFVYSLPVLAATLLCIRPDNLRELVATPQRRFLAVLGAFSALCFALLPGGFAGQSLIFQRHTIFMYLVMICWLSFLLPSSWRRPAALAAFAMAAAFSILWFVHFSRFDRWVSGISEVLAGRGKTETMAAIIGGEYFGRVTSIVHYNNYHIVWNGGIATTLLIDYPSGIIRRRASLEELPRYHDRDWGPPVSVTELLARYASIDLLLVHGHDTIASVARHGDWALARRSRRWALFEKSRKEARADPPETATPPE